MRLKLEVDIMYKFTSFDEHTFYKAIEEKDYSRLKTCIISSIRNNPGFLPMKGEKVAESKVAMNILKEKAEGMFEPYKVQEGERVFDEGEAETWDKEYFIRQTFLLGENFCTKRYNNLLMIGRKITRGIDPNFQEPQELCQAESQHQPIKENAHKAPQKTNPLLVLGTVALAIIVLVVIVAVIR